MIGIRKSNLGNDKFKMKRFVCRHKLSVSDEPIKGELGNYPVVQVVMEIRT